MKKLILFSTALALCLSLTAFAQNSTKGAQGNSASETKTLTGCIQKSDQPGEFTLTSDYGNKWDLRSSTVKLDQHVGHQVAVSGEATRQAKTQEKKEGSVEKAAGKAEIGLLRVDSLKMISQSCAK